MFLCFMFGNNIYTQAQTKVQQYFRNPIDSPMYLSGNFCQIRDGHFHYGLDLPTNNAEGWPITAVADGYISRIFVASYGYGNALFITHPNGLMSVYAHLRNFNEVLDDYTLNQHYKRQSNSLDIFPQKNILKVKKGDIIAYSGNSGGSTGPHLHFEIRNSKNELLNPQYFFDIPDTMPPVIGDVRFLYEKTISTVDFNDSGFVQGDTFYFPEGKIYLESEIYDRMIFEPNRLAPKSYSLYINNVKSFECEFNTYTFDQNKYVDTHIDYDAYWNTGKRFQKLYREIGSPMKFYKNNYSGFIQLKKGETYEIRIEAVDFNGVKTQKNAILKCSDTIYLEGFFKFTGSPRFHIDPKLALKIISTDSFMQIGIAGNTFLEKTTMDIHGYENSNMYLVYLNEGSHKPFLKPILLKIKLSDSFRNMNTTKLYIGYQTENSKGIYCGGKVNNQYIQTPISIPGNYFIGIDTLPPTIQLDSSASNYISFNIKDDLSGIGYYKATIDGMFALVSYDAKNNKLIIKKNKNTPLGKHLLKILIADKKQNYNSWEGAVVFE